MPNRIDIDHTHSRAIVKEIGERLRAYACNALNYLMYCRLVNGGGNARPPTWARVYDARHILPLGLVGDLFQ